MLPGRSQHYASMYGPVPPIRARLPRISPNVRAVKQRFHRIGKGCGIPGSRERPRHLGPDDLAQRAHVAGHHAQAAGHGLHRLERGNELADPVAGARHHEQVEDGVVAAHLRHRHPPGEDGDAGEAELPGQTLQRGPFGAVTHDERPDRAAAAAQLGGRFQQRPDALVGHQVGDQPGHQLAGPDAERRPHRRAVGQRLQELRGHGVGHHDDLARVGAARDDLRAHDLTQRDNEVRLGHAAGFRLPAEPVEVAGHEVSAGQPGGRHGLRARPRRFGS